MLWENSPFTMLELRIITFVVCSNIIVLHENIDQTLLISLYGLLNCEIGGLNCCVITTENIYLHLQMCPLNTHVPNVL